MSENTQLAHVPQPASSDDVAPAALDSTHQPGSDPALPGPSHSDDPSAAPPQPSECTPFCNTPADHPIRRLFGLHLSQSNLSGAGSPQRGGDQHPASEAAGTPGSSLPSPYDQHPASEAAGTPSSSLPSPYDQHHLARKGYPQTTLRAAGSPRSPLPSPEPVVTVRHGSLRRFSELEPRSGSDMEVVLGRGAGSHEGGVSVGDKSVRAGEVMGREEAAARKIQAWWREVLTKQDVEARPFCRYGKLAQHLLQRWVSGEWAPEPPFLSSSRLVLHLDINKTILMSDRVQDANTDHIVNMLLSECAWGRLEPGPCWMPVGRLATDRPSADPELMTYRVFLDSFFLPFRNGGGPEAERHNSAVKMQRQKLKRIFTEEGQPGHMFRGVFKELQRALYLRDEEKAAANRFLSTSQLFATGERRLLPSFFHLLLHLQRQGQPFSLVFRTFGSDINDVVEEINLFATGQHPSFPDVRMDGSDGVTDIRLTPASCGVMVRTSGRADGTILCWPAPPHLLAAKQHTLQQVQEEAAAGRAQSIQGMTQVYEHMKRITLQPGNRAIAIRDFYPYWKIQNERSGAGKLLLLEEDDFSCIQIFFDDNIGYGSAHIVDARNPHTASSLPFLQLFNKHLVKAEPLNAILDNKYFIRMVSACEMEVLQERTMKRILNRLSRLETVPSGRDGRDPHLQREYYKDQQTGARSGTASLPPPPSVRIPSWGAASIGNDTMASTGAGTGTRHKATAAGLLGSTFPARSARSYVARTSMVARLRWDMATRKIRLMVRVLLYLKGH